MAWSERSKEVRKNRPLLCVPSDTCTATRVQRRRDTARCRLRGL
ncbi:unnamed protein product [Laminaria digitata]